MAGPAPLIAVAGATGTLGSRICGELLERGARVRALARDPDAAPARGLATLGADVAHADVIDPPSLGAALEGAACVVSTATCFPHRDEIDAVDRNGNVALVEAAEATGVARFVFVSFKPVPLDFPLQHAKRAVEGRLAEAEFDAVVLRPGKFMDVWFSPLCGFDRTARRATLFGAGTAPVSWIAAADVAAVAARSALGEGPRDGVVELGGPEALSQQDVVAVFAEVDGAPWETETLPLPELERMYRDDESDLVRSLGALMLEAHLGATTDPASWRAAFPGPATTVREYAAAQAG